MELRVPASGDSVEEVELVEWMAVDGQQVKEGDPLYSIETGKSVIEIAAPVSGTLQIVAQKGETLAVGQLVAQIA
jgi:pyruvate/2-oxoglutarate dehydrogenase complex dihydrolipoamide acyltransferase (E2) component